MLTITPPWSRIHVLNAVQKQNKAKHVSIKAVSQWTNNYMYPENTTEALDIIGYQSVTSSDFIIMPIHM